MDLFGKTSDELQENIVITDDAITGTLKYVEGYTGFSSKTAERKGNYLAITATTLEPADSITVELVNGTKGPVTLDEDGTIVIRVTDPSTQSIRVVITKDGNVSTHDYSISNLVLETQEVVTNPTE